MSYFLALPDLHVTDPGPATRTDNVLDTQMRRLYRLLKKYRTKVDGVLIPGDIGDSRRWSNRAWIEFHDWVRAWEVPVVGILGQHDLRAHSLETFREVSHLALLDTALDNFFILTDDNPEITVDGCLITGASFMGKVWERFTDEDEQYRLNGILLAHAPVCDGTWPGAIDVRELDLAGKGFLVFGDIHKGFDPIKLPLNKKIIAMGGGALTPMKRDELEFKSRAFLIDTKHQLVEVIDLRDDKPEFTEAAMGEEFESSGFVAALDKYNYLNQNPLTLKEFVTSVAEEMEAPAYTVKRILQIHGDN